MRKFTEVRKHSQCACLRSFFSARAEIPFRLHETFSDFQARLAGLKTLARFENTFLESTIHIKETTLFTLTCATHVEMFNSIAKD